MQEYHTYIFPYLPLFWEAWTTLSQTNAGPSVLLPTATQAKIN